MVGPSGCGKTTLLRTLTGQVPPLKGRHELGTSVKVGYYAQAHEQRKKQDWWGYEATLNKIIKVAPHFVSVWRFQAHNLSYNIASEFDDYRHKYEWTKKGIALLKEGRKYNDRDPRLVYELGWFTCHKIGQSDDAPLFRRMFKDEEGRDSWLAGKQWYLAAQDALRFEFHNPTVVAASTRLSCASGSRIGTIC